jgi:transcriptional regulator with XRE-family HTH domain
VYNESTNHKFWTNKGGNMNLNKIKGLMAEHGERQEDIAKLLNINISTVNFKLQGKSEFKVSELKTLADHYKVDINIFLTN